MLADSPITSEAASSAAFGCVLTEGEAEGDGDAEGDGLGDALGDAEELEDADADGETEGEGAILVLKLGKCEVSKLASVVDKIQNVMRVE